MRDLIGFVVHPLLGQRQAQVVGQGRQQVDSWSACLREPLQRFAIKRYGGLPAEGATGVLTMTPSAQAPNFASTASRSTCQDRVQRRRTRCVVSKAQRMRDTGAVIAPPFGNGAIAAIATQHRTTGQREWRARDGVCLDNGESQESRRRPR